MNSDLSAKSEKDSASAILALVLCDPEGQVSIPGSQEDRRLVVLGLSRVRELEELVAKLQLEKTQAEQAHANILQRFNQRCEALHVCQGKLNHSTERALSISTALDEAIKAAMDCHTSLTKLVEENENEDD